MYALLRAVLHQQPANPWLALGAACTAACGRHPAPSAWAGPLAHVRGLRTAPVNTDRTPYRPAPDGSDPVLYWERKWRERPDVSRKQRQSKDPRRIPRSAFLATWETGDMDAFRRTLQQRTSLDDDTIRCLAAAADQGTVSRSGAAVAAQVQRLMALRRQQLPDLKPVKLLRTKPSVLGQDLSAAAAKLVDGLQPLKGRAQLAACLLNQMPGRVCRAPTDLAAGVNSLPGLFQQVLGGVPLDLEQLPPSACRWAGWSPGTQLRRLELLRDRFGTEGARLVALSCPSLALQPDGDFAGRLQCLRQLLGWPTGPGAAAAAAHHPRLLLLQPDAARQAARATLEQLQGSLGLGPEEAQAWLSSTPQLLVTAPSSWQDVLARLQRRSIVDADLRAPGTRALLQRAPGLLLRAPAAVISTVDALRGPAEALGLAKGGLAPVLREVPEALLLQAAEATRRGQQLLELSALSGSWKALLDGTMARRPADYARVLVSPTEQFQRLQLLVVTRTRDAPSDKDLGLLDLLQMPRAEFEEMYAAARVAAARE